MSKGSVGFVGVGNMGFPMAGRLVDAGYDVVAYDISEDALGAITNKGAKGASSAADVASQVETVFVSLPKPEHVHAVAFGDAGVSAGSKRTVFVDLSTTGPQAAAKNAEGLAAQGIKAIDAPVSGGVGGAQKGTLAVMVSGPKAECDALRPAFEVIGKYFYVSETPGHGQMMKIINNLLSATAMAATCEAVVLGQKAGLDPHIMIDIVNASSGRSTASEQKFPQSILPRTFDYGFSMGLMSKDVNLCLSEAEAMNFPMFIGKAVQQMWLHGVAQGGPDEDFTNLFRYIEAFADAKGDGGR